MGHKYTRDELLAGALDTARTDGLSQLTFGRVAKRLGVSDRVLVYYFPTKDDLVSAVLASMGSELQVTLASALTGTASDHVALARQAWPVLASPDADPVFALFFEANGLAAAGREPYASLVGHLVEAWITWVMDFFDGPPTRRRAEAEATIALIDGLLLVRQLVGAAAADRAAATLGIR